MTSAVPYAEVIGDPIGHSKSPLIHDFWLGKLGMQGEYRATRVGKDDLPGYLNDRRRDPAWRGCNLTMPLKEAALPLAARRSHDAELVKATNCIVAEGCAALCAHNTDVDGVRAALSDDPLRPARGSAATLFNLIGTGGAARAALAELRGREFTIFGRDLAKARALAGEFGAGEGSHRHLDALVGNDQPVAKERRRYVIINATSLGMTGHPTLEIRLDAYPANTIVIDMVYDPLETELLKEARRLGMVAVDGLVMLIGQAARAFELFFGAPPPREHDAELRRLLTA